MAMQVDDRRPRRQDTCDLRDQIVSDDHVMVQNHADAALHYHSPDDEEHSVLEDDSDGEDRDVDYMDEDDDGSSSLSIPNESIDFDLVYSLHSFAATVEGQANVVKGDSLFLMDDSNSYWWLVRVLKTQEVGYIPAENIETPFERLARLNKHRNVDVSTRDNPRIRANKLHPQLASATQAELQEGAHASRDALRNNLSSRQGQRQTPSPLPAPGESGARQQQSKGVAFTPALSVHRYPPAVWNEDEEEDEDVEWDDEGYEDEDPDLADEQMQQRRDAEGGPMAMEPDDGMGWDDSVAEDMQQARAIPAALKPGPGAEQHEQILQAQQRHQLALTQQQQLQQQQPQALRNEGSRELMESDSSSPKRLDPAEATLETRKLSVTPSIAREGPEPQPISALQPNGPLLPSAIMQKQDEERKRTREEIEALEESARKKVHKNKEKSGSVSSTNSAKSTATAGSNTSKIRKDKELEDEAREREREKEKEKEKKNKGGGIFGGLFGRRKEKGKEKNTSSVGSVGSIGSMEGDPVRGSEDSNRPSVAVSRPSVASPESAVSSTTAQAAVQQEQVQVNLRSAVDPKRTVQTQQATSQQPSELAPHVSQHASQLRQRDQHQQALYQKYLNSSPSSPPEAQPSYGLQSASAVMPVSNSFANAAPGTSLGPPAPRARPGSLILSPTTGESHVPELSVIRVFAGKHVQTEATFKTVLLNTSTTSDDLIRQAIQRFRLPAGENVNDYYLTVKQVEGSTAVLHPGENPLGVFETLVEAAMEVPKVKRSSVGSISSLASNLSMHPAIKKLSMNDFTDDSAVKLYLNRKGGDDEYDSGGADDSDVTIMADTSHGDESDTHERRLLSVSTGSINSVTAERFSSPSFRFALQLVIYPDDLPDDMVFDPLTEAIVFKETLRDRSPRGSVTSPGVSQTMRRKVFVFPKNVTVAEVIEIGLERFGILEGVVDGGDEVEDKLTKRRSSIRVRYGLNVDVVGNQGLFPSSSLRFFFLTQNCVRARTTAVKQSDRSIPASAIISSCRPPFIRRKKTFNRLCTTPWFARRH
jgi:hypothetical protein